ncbi:hypothetical protein [Haloferax sp. Atlit-48N]|uniref:Uncharacterized protein n=1 Tax=Haloferax sp. Atlit-48N TaxID=2077198 RepID=A0ACD5HXC4_9EURY|nr:hypothetical protein [Haloferax sp. Atlit-48N]
MVSQPELTALRDCILKDSISDVTQIRLRKPDVIDCLSTNDIDTRVFDNLNRYFSTSKSYVCPNHGEPPAVCGCPIGDCEQIVEYSIDRQGAIEQWVDWVVEEDIFDYFKIIDGSDPATVKAVYDESDVRFKVFFDESRFTEYDINPKNLEFRVSFFTTSKSITDDIGFFWHEFFEEKFLKNFRTLLQKWESSHYSNICDYSSVEGFKQNATRSIEKYLDKIGFNIIHDPSVIDAARKYGIKTKNADFAAVSDERSVLVCECERSNKWHIHLFHGDKIHSVEDDPDIKHLVTTIRQKVTTYGNVEKSKEGTRGKAAAANTIAALAGGLSLLFNFSNVQSYIEAQTNISVGIELVSTILFFLTLLIIVATTVVSFGPYLYGWFIFSWDISTSTEAELEAGDGFPGWWFLD